MHPHSPILAPLLSILALLAFGLRAQAAADGRVVAVLELDAPRHSPFTLRATLPIPKGVYPRADGQTPFAVRSRGAERALVPAQVEIVSRYPTGEADVVELLARVELDRGDQPGARVRFDVQLEPSAPLPAPRGIAPRLRALLAPEHGGRLELRARDVFGNAYAFDLLAAPGAGGVHSRRDLKRGAWLVEQRIAGVLAPAESPAPEDRALPRLMGVHAYLGTWTGEPAISLDVRIHNGTIEPGGRLAPLGIVYWQSLELAVPPGFALVPDVRDPFFGEPYELDGARVYPLVAPFDDGALHMMGPQAQFHRRLALAAEEHALFAAELVQEQGLAFCVAAPNAWSWFDPATARYFPQRDLLANMDFYERGGARGKNALRAHERARYDDVRSQIETGTARDYPRQAHAMGWAHPWFLASEGGHGGEEIDWIDGHRAAAAGSRESYLRHELVHRMNQSRQSEAVYDLEGDALGYFEWRGADGSLPFQFRPYGRGVIPPFALPCFGGPAASEQVREVARQQRRPPYDRSKAADPKGGTSGDEGDLLTWMPHDGAHIVRYAKHAKALVWLGNDSLAKDDLRLGAELFRLYFHEAPGAPDSWRWPTSLWEMEQFAARHPHRGLDIHRQHGWGIDLVCATYSMADDDWRARARPWCERVADLLLLGATPGGLINRGECPPLENDAVDGCTTFHNEIVLLAHRGLVESVFRGVDRARVKTLEEGLVHTCEYLFWGPAFTRMRESWSSPEQPVYKQGPAWYIPIAPADDSAPPYSDTRHWGANYLPRDVNMGGPEAEYGFALLAFASDATQESAGRGLTNRYLRRTLELGAPTDSWRAKFEGLVAQISSSSFDNTPSTIGYLARLQGLGALR